MPDDRKKFYREKEFDIDGFFDKKEEYYDEFSSEWQEESLMEIAMREERRIILDREVLLSMLREQKEIFRQRLEKGSKEEMKAKKIAQEENENVAVSPETEVKIENLSVGEPLDKETKEHFEESFGKDFSDVKIHTDKESAEIAEEVDAKAFTKGEDIVFNEGEFEPGTAEGKELIAHELGHVADQGKIAENTIARAPKPSHKRVLIEDRIKPIAPIVKDEYNNEIKAELKGVRLSFWAIMHRWKIFDSQGTCVFKETDVATAIKIEIPKEAIAKGKAEKGKPWKIENEVTRAIGSSDNPENFPYTYREFYVYNTRQDLYETLKSSTIKKGLLDNLDEKTSIALFKDTIRSIAIKRLEENKRHLEENENSYLSKYSEGDKKGGLNANAFNRLKKLIEKDIELKKRQDVLEEKYITAKDLYNSKYTPFLRYSPTYKFISKASYSSNEELFLSMKLWEREYQKAKETRVAFLKLYPELTVIDKSKIKNKSNEEIYSYIKSGFKDIKDSIEDIKEKVNEKERLLTKLGPVIYEAMKELRIDNEYEDTKKLRKNVIAWMENQDKKEEQYKIAGTAISVTLGIGAFFAVVLTKGLALPLLLAVGGALAGIPVAVTSFQTASDIWDIARIQKSFKKDLIDREAEEQAKFDYVIGMVNLILAGLDLVLAGKSAYSMLKLNSVVKRLAGAGGSKILADLQPDHIIRFEYLMRVEAAGDKALADKLVRQLKIELKSDYNKAYGFFRQNRDILYENRIRINTRKKLYGYKFQHNDIDRILDMLDNSNEGSKIRKYILSEKFAKCEGYGDLLLRIKLKEEPARVLQAMEEADELMKAGYKRIIFEPKVKPGIGQSNIDIDVAASVAMDEEWSLVQQLKIVDSNKKLSERIIDAANQLKDAPAKEKWVIIKVKKGTWKSFETENDLIELYKKFKNDYPGIKIKIIFSDNIIKNFPE